LPGVAMAHSLPDSENHLQQLIHQLFSLHHLPTLILLVALYLLILGKKRRGRLSLRKFMNS
jgi:hypothetical protein